MKKSIIITAMLAAGVGVTGVSAAALNAPYQGSDTLFNLTQTAIADINTIGPKTAYVGGGSGNGQSAMAAGGGAFASATQQTAPMSRMVNSGGSACKFNSDSTATGANLKSASGIVIGLDAVDVLSNINSGAQTSGGTCNAAGEGLAASGTTGVFAAGTQNWKWILALVYGGKDLSPGGITDCNSSARANLVSNWSKLFQAGCSPSAAAGPSGVSAASVCAAGSAANGVLWHAFRRDEASGTSDVFASLLGLSPSTSNSAINGFGTSPYCNALNWDTQTGNATSCGFGPNDQWTGPGGIVDPASKCVIATGACTTAGAGNHRRPPPGTWGDNPDPGQTTNSADVLPTQMQDNDPIRRPCLGGATNNHARVGEEVCNLDGQLGLVLPMVDTDWIVSAPAVGKQYPTNNCTGFTAGLSVSVLNCAPRGTGKHSGECANGDSLIGGACSVPIDGPGNTSQCVSSSATIAPLHSRTLGSAYGRMYNTQMRDGSTVSPSVGFLQYPIPAAVPPTTTDMAGAYNRIHQVETAVGAAAPGCQMEDMTDQIGCLAAADPCSIGYAGDASKTWASRPNGFTGTSTDPAGTWDVGALQVAAVAPSVTTVQKLGLPGEYQFSRKLYMNSLVGFANVATTAGDPGASAELVLADNEASPTFMAPLLSQYSFFPLGPQVTSANQNLCEDLNEKTVCGNAANANGCLTNVAPIPGAGANESTVCGNGVVDPFEECDGTVKAGAGGCTATCRCVLDYNSTTGACN